MSLSDSAPRRVTRWLARDVDGKYVLATESPGFFRPHGTFYVATGDYLRVSAREWHALGGLRLRPGQGPVRVRVRIVVEREGRRC